MRILVCLLVAVALAGCGEDSGGGSSSEVDESVAYPLGQICSFERWQLYTATYTYTEGTPNYAIEREGYTSDTQEEPPVCVRMVWDDEQGNWGGFTVSEGLCSTSGAVLTTVTLAWDAELDPKQHDLSPSLAEEVPPVVVKGGLKTVLIESSQETRDLNFSDNEPFTLPCDEANPICRYNFCDGTQSLESFPDGT